MYNIGFSVTDCLIHGLQEPGNAVHMYKAQVREERGVRTRLDTRGDYLTFCEPC